ncbi:MAG TPA: DinB family protein [Acidobacteriota bacterium]|nr:DinB family protein [Acidobacteriota bacterium]
MDETALREQVAEFLTSRGAHLDFEAVVKDFPEGLRGKKAPGLPHTGWQLLEHLRICLWDILEFSRAPDHVSPDFPTGYWPEDESPPTPEAWDKCVDSIRRDLRAMQDLVRDESRDLFKPFPHGQGQNLLREALLIADHNAYHLGQLVDLRRLLGVWPPS